MKRRAFIALAATVAFAGCGGSTHHSGPVARAQPCNPPPGSGTAGVCAAKPKPGAPRFLTTAGTLIPDTSEFTASCAVYSPVIFRAYEAGTELQDAKAACFARAAQRKHLWDAAYVFLRPGHGGCTHQADVTVGIVNRLGGVVGPVIGDAEVWLPPGFVACFLARVKHDGYPPVEYTCPGCGDEMVGRVWIAAYPYRPPGVWVAHQFSSEIWCRGIYGDCSVDEGILGIRRVNRAALERRRAALTHVLVAYGCRRRVAHRERLGPRCKRWFAEGDRLNAELGRTP